MKVLNLFRWTNSATLLSSDMAAGLGKGMIRSRIWTVYREGRAVVDWNATGKRWEMDDGNERGQERKGAFIYPTSPPTCADPFFRLLIFHPDITLPPSVCIPHLPPKGKLVIFVITAHMSARIFEQWGGEGEIGGFEAESWPKGD